MQKKEISFVYFHKSFLKILKLILVIDLFWSQCSLAYTPEAISSQISSRLTKLNHLIKTKVNSQISTQFDSRKNMAYRQAGQFQLIYQPTTSYPELEKALRKYHLFEIIIHQLNTSGLILPVNLPVILRECDQVNAFYDPVEKNITMCYEFILGANKDFEKIAEDEREETGESAVYATIFAFYHELGHALIDILKLPTVGEEEGAVDEFAAIILLNTNNKASNHSSNESEDFQAQIVLNGAIWFGIQPQGPFWDEHPAGDKRFFNLLCLIYGSNPDKYRPIIATVFKHILANENAEPEQLQRRGSMCEQEYPKKLESWTKLLIPHFARSSGGWGRSRVKSPSPYVPPSNNGRNPGRVW